MSRRARIDKTLAALIAVLVLSGLLIFASAAFGLLARGATHMSSVVFSHLVLGVGLGTLGLLVATYIDYRVWRKYAPHLYILALILTAAVFLPHIGFSHGGARRWLLIAGFSFQPAELLKITSVILAAAYFSAIKDRVDTFIWGFGGFVLILLPPVFILINQPDIGTLGIISISVAAVFFAAGASWKQIGVALCIALLALSTLAYTKPYIRDRIETFVNPALEQQAQGYQIRQSLIAIGSGGLTGRGFGQGVQKFTYLPEPMGDSIFAVAAEELGFAGAVGIVLLFLLFALRGFLVSTRATDLFGALLAVGISTYLASEAFINIAAMLGVAPLTGIPLTFISQGGSAMLVSLGSAGVLLSISRRRA